MKDRIKQIRAHFGLSQAQLAHRINKSPGLIALVEAGMKNLSMETTKAICTALPVNEEWLLTGIGEITSAAPVDKENIKKRIKQVRKENNLTQEEFGKRIGYSPMQISYIETGRTSYSDELTHRVASTFSVNYEWLMTGVGEMHSPVEDELNDELIAWLRVHPEVVKELKVRSGVK